VMTWMIRAPTTAPRQPQGSRTSSLSIVERGELISFEGLEHPAQFVV
jgi:hypothetical protein